jgi:hypothetical protein
VTPLTIPVTGGRSSQSPPTRHQTALLKLPATSDSAGGFRGASASPIKQQQPPTPAPPDYHKDLGGLTNGVEGGSAHRNNNNNNKHNSSSNTNNNTVRLGSSPFWCGVASRDPLSRYKKTLLSTKKKEKFFVRLLQLLLDISRLLR